MIRVITLILLIITNLASYKDNSEDDRNKSDYDSLTASFSVKDKFGVLSNAFVVGDEIHFEIRVENTSNKSITYWNSDGGPSGEITVYKGEERIWSPYDGLGWTQALTERTIEASEIILIKHIWTGLDSNKEMVSPGNYTIFPRIGIPIKEENNSIPEFFEIILQ